MSRISGLGVNNQYNQYNNQEDASLYSSGANGNQANSLQPVQATGTLNDLLRNSGITSGRTQTFQYKAGDEDWATGVYKQIKAIFDSAEKTDQGTVKLTDSQKDKILDLLTNGAWSKAKASGEQPNVNIGDNLKLESTANGGLKATFTNPTDNSQTKFEIDGSGNVSGSYDYNQNGTRLSTGINGQDATVRAELERSLGNGATAKLQGTLNTLTGNGKAELDINGVKLGRDTLANFNLKAKEDGTVTGTVKVDADLAKILNAPEGTILNVSGKADSNGNLDLTLKGTATDGTSINAKAKLNTSTGSGEADVTIGGVKLGNDVTAGLNLRANQDGSVSGTINVTADLAKILGLKEGTKLGVTGSADSSGNYKLEFDAEAKAKLGENATIKLTGRASVDQTGRVNYDARAGLEFRF
jgi:hypothetical protein